MTPVMIALFASLLVGIGLTAYGVVGMMTKKEEPIPEFIPTRKNETDDSQKDVDKIMSELSDFSENVFKDVDGKHQELMFLYTLIDEKKQELVEAYTKSMETQPPVPQQEPQVPPQAPQQQQNINEYVDTSRYVDTAKWEKEREIKTNKEEFGKNLIDSNPQHRQIYQLYSNGATVPEIARELNIGQMEVKLILELLVGN